MKRQIESNFLSALCFLMLLVAIQAVSSTALASTNLQCLVDGWKMARVPDIAQNGLQISQSSFNESNWINAVVPGTVLTSYERSGLIADPYFGINMASYDRLNATPGVDGTGYYNTNYWYRDTFVAPSAYSGQRIWLNFDGINWKAEIYVNGSFAGTIKGPFLRGKLDVTALVTPGASNYLAVKLYWSNATIYDAPTFVASQGWDFMPQIAGRNVGIYEKVYLTTSGAVNIVDPFVTTTLPLPSTSPANVGIQVGLTNCSNASVTGTLSGLINPEGVTFTQSVTMSALSASMITFSNAAFPQLSITNPALWWPNGYGPQNLHTLQLTFQNGTGVSDAQTVTFGIRQYSYNTNGHELWVSVNGQQVMCKGGNYGMPDAMLKFTDAQMDMAVRLHKEMNFTMIRCWHGNADFKSFYDACDKYGIMVWDEFWLNGSNFGAVPNDTAMFKTNAIDKYKRLRNHAALAVWCGENEAVPPAQLQLHELYNQLDGTRIYIDASNQGPVHGGGPYEEVDPKWYFSNAHGFTTELGSTVVPSVESMQAMIPTASLWPPGDTNWVLHNWQYNVSGYTNALSTRYGAVSGIDDFCKKAQYLNSETYKAMFEAWNEKMWNDCGGLLLWMSQAAWPSIVWQTYDYYFEPTGAYFGSKKACEPLHIQWNLNNGSIKVVNNTLSALSNLTAQIQVYNQDSTLKYETNVTGISVPADSVFSCADLFSAKSLSLNRPVVASSIDNNSDAATNAVDGNWGSRWSSAYSDPQWLYVDLGTTQTVSMVTIFWESYAKAFQIQVSNDTTNWTSVWSTNNMVLGAAGFSTSLFTPTAARYVRMYGTSRATMWGYSMWEFQVFAGADNSWMSGLSSTHFIKLKLKDNNGNLLSDNFYLRGVQPLNYSSLSTLTNVSPVVSSAYSASNNTATITATLTNASSGIAFGARLKLVNQTSGARVLPAIYSDNYFSLLPHETKTVSIEFTNNALSSGPLQLMLSGLNIPSQQVSTLTVNAAVPYISAPVITPANPVPQGTAVTLSCNWSGTAPVAFQWQSSTNGAGYTNINGATTNFLMLPNPTTNDSGYYKCIFTAANGSITSSVASLTVISVGGLPVRPAAPRLSVKFAADKDWGHDAIDNTYGAGVFNTTNWFNLKGPNGASNGVTQVPFYTVAGVTNASATMLVYNYAGENAQINNSGLTLANNVALQDSWIVPNNNGWYLSATNLDAVFTNGYVVYFYYNGNASGRGGQNYLRSYVGQTTNTPLAGVKQWNLFTTTATNTGSFTRDLTPGNTGTGGETTNANYLVFTNLSGGAFDLLITNGISGGIGALEIIARAATTATVSASINGAPYGTVVSLTTTVSPMPPDGGSVTFMDAGVVIGVSPVINGTATFNVNSLVAGAHPITATYAGDMGYLACTSGVFSLSVTSVTKLPGVTILDNGGFETGMNGWLTNLSGGSAATFSRNSSGAHSGANVLQVSVTNPGNSTNAVELVSPPFMADSTNTYVLRFWANTDVLKANLGIVIKGATPAFPQIPFQLSTNAPGNYQEYIYAFRAAGSVNIAFDFQTQANYYLDDVEILDVNNSVGWDVPLTYIWQWGQLNYSKTNSLGWSGGDNNKSVLLPDGSVAWLFNDSYSSTITNFYTNIRGGASLPRNCLVHQVGTNLYWMNNGNQSFFAPTNSDYLCWIGGGVVEGNKLLVLLNELNNSPLTNVCMTVATLSLPGLTLDSTTRLTGITANFGDLIKGDDGYYYIYDGPKIARTPIGSLAVQSAWTYWNGSTWGADETKSVALANLVSPWSFVRLGNSNYATLYMPSLSLSIMAQYAPSPMGPWSQPALVYTTAGESYELNYMPNVVAGTGSNGVYTIGYSDNGAPESWFDKTASDKSWYRPHYVKANLLQLSPYSIMEGNGAAGSRMGIKFAADLNWGNASIKNTYGAGALNTTNWFNLTSGARSDVVNVPFYTSVNGDKYSSGMTLVYKYANEINAINNNQSMSNNVALLDSFANTGDNCWFLSVTNLDAAFTNSYSVYVYYHGSSVNWGGNYYLTYHAGQSSNTMVLGTKQWNLHTTDTSNTGLLIQDLTPSNIGTAGETPGANYFVFSNLTGGAFDLMITNGSYGGVNAIEIVANPSATTPAPTVSAPLALPSNNVFVGTKALLVCSNYSGLQPYTFQWQSSVTGTGYTNITGALTNMLALEPITVKNAAFYRLVFTAAGQSVTSSVVQLTTRPLPTLGFQVANGIVILSWPQGTLLQATNILGPWQTNNSGSPYTNQPSSPQLFYRVITQ